MGRFKKEQNRALMPLRSVQRQLEFATLNNAGLDMTAAPGMRDLAHRLLTYEAGAGKASEPMESSVLRVYEKLRQCLGQFVGGAGFQLLASRALTLAKPEAPSLNAVQVAADGSIEGLSEIETQFEIDKNQEPLAKFRL